MAWNWLASLATSLLANKAKQTPQQGIMDEIAKGLEGKAIDTTGGAGPVSQMRTGQTVPPQAPVGGMQTPGPGGLQIVQPRSPQPRQPGPMAGPAPRQPGLMAGVRQRPQAQQPATPRPGPKRALTPMQWVDATLYGTLTGGGLRGIPARANQLRNQMKRDWYDKGLRERLSRAEPGSRQELDIMRALAEPEGGVGTVPARQPRFVSMTQRQPGGRAQDFAAVNPQSMADLMKSPWGAEYEPRSTESRTERDRKIDAARLRISRDRFAMFDPMNTRLAYERKSGESEKQWMKAVDKIKPLMGPPPEETEEEKDGESRGALGSAWDALWNNPMSPDAQRLLEQYQQ